MQAIIRAHLDGEGAGIITTAEARQLGASAAVLRAMERAGLVTRLTRGSYVCAKQWNPTQGHPAGADPFELAQHRHLLRLGALLRTYGDKVAASHQSAVLAWGLPTQHASLERVHLIHGSRGRTARRFETFTIHTCELSDVIVTHDGRRVVIAPLAAIGQAMTVGALQGAAAIDAAIVKKLTTKRELEELLERMRHTPRIGLARRAVSLADGLAESPGETRLRLLLVELGITFIAQHWIRIGTGSIHYRVDFYLPELGVILEYDGKVKYTQAGPRVNANAGQKAQGGKDALVQEKVREDDLRLEGFGVGRVTVADLNGKRLESIIAAARRQVQPTALRRAAEPPHWAGKGS